MRKAPIFHSSGSSPVGKRTFCGSFTLIINKDELKDKLYKINIHLEPLLFSGYIVQDITRKWPLIINMSVYLLYLNNMDCHYAGS